EDGRRPRPGAEALPDREVVVLHDGVPDVALADRGGYAVVRALPEELWGVDADDREARPRVPSVPVSQLRDHVVAVDAAIGPELHQHHATAEPVERQRLAVDPRSA